MTAPLMTGLMLLGCWLAWWAAGWLVEILALWPVELPFRFGVVLLFLTIVGEAVDRRLH